MSSFATRIKHAVLTFGRFRSVSTHFPPSNQVPLRRLYDPAVVRQNFLPSNNKRGKALGAGMGRWTDRSCHHFYFYFRLSAGLLRPTSVGD